MMPQQKSKKIFLFIFLFVIIATFNNRNMNEKDLFIIDNIFIDGLDEKKKLQLIEKLNFLKKQNIFFLNKIEIKETIETNNLIEKYSIFKLYPSSLNIDIEKTNFLAAIKKEGNTLLLGSNGKLIESNELDKNLPLIFGDFKIDDFFKLKKAMDETNFDFKDVKNVFKSGRWDIETKNGLIIKLPKDELQKSFQIFIGLKNIKELGETKNEIYDNITRLLLMSDILDYETYLLISPKKFIISVNTELEKKVYYEELIINSNLGFNKFEKLDFFLNQNIFKVEKKFKNFVEKIIIILDLDIFFPVEISIKKDNYDNFLNLKNLKHLLYEAKQCCKKTLDKKKVVHMLIKNYRVDNKIFLISLRILNVIIFL